MILLGLLTGIIGAVFRRYWGGWESPKHWVKLIIGFTLPIVITFLGCGNLELAVLAGLFIGLGFLNPDHAEFMRFGVPSGDKPNPSPLKCFTVYSLSYGLFPFLLGGISTIMGQGHWYAAFYGLAGAVAAGIYWLGAKYWPIDKQFLKTGKTADGKDCFFIDCKTAIGELGLGAAIFGLLPLVF